MKIQQLIGTLLAVGGFVTANEQVEAKRQVVQRRQTKRVPIKGRSHPIIPNPNGSSQNWAGSVKTVISGAYSGTEGTINVPKVNIPLQGKPSTLYGGRAWVGVDGSGNCSSMVSAGIQWSIQNGQTKYEAFYQVYPGPAYLLNLTVNPGDQVQLGAGLLDGGGSAGFSLNNQNTGQNAEAVADVADSCRSSGEWVIEDYQIHSSLVPLAVFEPVTFTNAYGFAQANSAGVVYATSGSLVSIEQDGDTKASCSKKLNKKKQAIGIECVYDP